MEHAHKEIVQPDIGGARHGDKIHGAFAVAKSTEDRADDIRRDERNAEKADGQVCGGAADCFLRRRHDGSNGADKQQKKNSQRDRNCHKKQHGVSDVLRRLFPVFRADCLRDADGCAHRKPDDHNREHMHDL